MEMGELSIIGLAVTAVGFAAKEVVSYFKEKSLKEDEKRLVALEKAVTDLKVDIEPMITQTKELHEWHNKSDEDGVKIWYIRKSLENVLRENAQATAVLARNSELQTTLLKEMIEGQKTIMHELRTQGRHRDG